MRKPDNFFVFCMLTKLTGEHCDAMITQSTHIRTLPIRITTRQTKVNTFSRCGYFSQPFIFFIAQIALSVPALTDLMHHWAGHAQSDWRSTLICRKQHNAL